MNLLEIAINFRLEESYSYEFFKSLMEELVNTGQTTGENQSDKYVKYTQLNHQRMKRLDKTIALEEETIEFFQGINREQIWVVLTESWCGDAAQNLPIINKISSVNPKIKLRVHLRDAQPALMDNFTTNGARSIPKLVIIDKDSQNVLGTWGPRPKQLQEMVLAHKKNPVMTSEEFSIATQQWYNKDKGLSLQKELINLLV